MRVISASRRTDIPAFYTPWLLQRLEAGFCHVVNPRSGEPSRVSLSPADVLAMGLFTRDPRPLVPHLRAMKTRGYRLFAHVTINGYPADIEPRSPEIRVATEAFLRLSDELGPRFTIWRYDPILVSERFDTRYHLERFATIARALEGATMQCVISFVDPYAKTRRNLAEKVLWEPGEPHERIATGLLGIAHSRGIRLTSCAEPAAEACGVAPAACVDPVLIADLRPDIVPRLRRASTREHCLCHQAIDIGAYHTCAFGCAYCYATETPSLGLTNRRLHDHHDSLLFRPASLAGVELESAPPALVHEGEQPALF